MPCAANEGAPVDTTPDRFKPPYMSFQTFWGYVDELGRKPLPPVIDRSMFASKSGTDQANLLAALKAFGLIADDLTVEPRLDELVSGDEDVRRKVLARLIEEHYPDALQVSANDGTEKMLHDSFREVFDLGSADTRRKAVSFFLHAARTAGLPLSPHFPNTRTTTAASRPRRPNTKRKPASPVLPQEQEVPPASQADSYKIDLHCGGSVTLTVTVSHFALSKDKKDREFVNKLIDALTDYGEVRMGDVPAEV